MGDEERSCLKSECKISSHETETKMVNYPQIPDTDENVKTNEYNNTSFHEKENESCSDNIKGGENDRKRKRSSPEADFLGFKKHCIEEASEYYRKCLKYSTLNFSSNLYNFSDINTETESVQKNFHKSIAVDVDNRKDDINGTSEKYIPVESVEITREQSTTHLNLIKDVDVNNATPDKSDSDDVDNGASQNLNSTKSEYAQYLGLQPTVKFKCIKCSTSNFPTLAALNKHLEKCPEQIDGPDSVASPCKQSVSSTDIPSTSTSSSTNFKITRRVYLCSACGVYFEIWKLFLHMRTAHRRYICLICLGLFSVAEKLSNHLVIKHNIVAKNYDSVQNFFRDYTGQIFVMCCTCEKMFTEKDNFAEHVCEMNNKDIIKPSNNLINSSYTCFATNSVNNQQTTQLTESVSPPQTSKPNQLNTNKNIKNTKLTNKLNLKLKNKILPSEHVTADTTFDTSITNQNNDAKESNLIEIPNSATTARDTDTEPQHTDREIIPEKDSNQITDPYESQKSEINSEQKNIDIHKNTLTDQNRTDEPENSILKDTLLSEMSSNIENETSEQKVQSPLISVTKQEKQDDSTVVDTAPPVKQEEDEEEVVESNNKSVDEKNQISDLSDISKEVMQSEQVCNEQRRVPKVTLKIPPITKTLQTVDSESDSDDSLKLTMEVDDNASWNQENKHDTSNNTDEANLDNSKENVSGEMNMVDEIKKENFIDGFAVADSNIPIVELGLRPPLDKVTIQSLLKDFIRATCFTCVYCNYARKIAVNGKQLGLHMIAEHRYSATADSITGEELLPETFVKRIKEDLETLQMMYFNLESYDNQDPEAMIPYDRTYECFQCRFVTTVHKELYLHNRKMHQKTLLLCVMCKSTFYSYSELLCHLCPGVYLGTDVMFRCCLCPIDNLPSAFRLMVHLRKRHHACDVCLETCNNQAKLSNHVWKHKLHHLCYRCGIAYRNKPDITKHLFWKHGTESVLCKKCLQKKWPHVYHFCIPPQNFTCDECNKSFTRAVALKVHKRLHSNIKPYACTEENCSEQFISKKLLEKHTLAHRDPSILNPIINAPTLESEPDVVEVETKETKSVDEECPKTDETKDVEIGTTKETSTEIKTKPVVDVYDLPALNLSESDSDSDDERPSVTTQPETKPNDEIMKKSETEEADMEDTKPVPIVDGIWDNFKNYQAAVEKRELGNEANKDFDNKELSAENKSDLKNENEPYLDSKQHMETLIQVIQDDHDYCAQPEEKQNSDKDKDKMDHNYCFGNENKTTGNEETRDDNSGNESKNKNNSDSSSDSDSSSCSCGSNCSCSSSSSGSSSSSSSSSDSESSSSESRRRNLERRQKRKEKIKNKKKTTEISVDDVVPEEQPQQNQPQLPLPVDLPIYESDLYTDESETDEDFYDKCPQLLAKKLIEEKKNQLLLDVGGPPSINGSLFETSRSSTPNIPEAQVTKKKQKIKSKKRKKNLKNKSPVQNQEVLPLKLNIPHSYFAQQALHNNIYSPNALETSVTARPSIQSPKLSAPPVPQPQPQIIPTTPTPIPSTTFNSNTGSGSETDSALRLSKRRRVPNKFYGYSSDEDSSSRIAKQPPPEPPQLQWNKEDLPSPPRISTIETADVPAIWNKTTVSQITPQTQPPANSSDSSESDADSDDERLHISQPNYSTTSTVPAVAPPTTSAPVTTPLPSIVPRPTENLYCYCQCPYDEVSEMIACDGKKCAIEWFHFECVGIMVPPKGKWFCPDCRKQNSQRPEYFASQ